MPNIGEDIISELESTFIDTQSIRNSIQTIDKQIIRLDKTLWDASPLLKQKSAEGVSFMALAVPQSVIQALLEVHRNRKFPKNYPELLNLLAVSCELKLEELAQLCADTILENIEDSLQIDYPSECSLETVMHCFKFMINGPLRSAAIYKAQLARVAKFCDNNHDVMINAMNLVKQKIKHFSSIGLEGIPVDFDERILPIVVYVRKGELQSAIFDGEYLDPVDIFGSHFSLGELRLEDSFYLKYGSYLLFKSGDSVYRKNLRGDDEPKKILSSCYKLLTRGKFVFAVHVENDDWLISRWTADAKFVRIYITSGEIALIDFHRNERLLAVQVLPSSLLLFTLTENDTLILLAVKEIPRLLELFLTEEEMRLVVEEAEEGDSSRVLQTYDLTELDDSTTPEYEMHLDEAYSRITLKQAGDEEFLVMSGALKIAAVFPSLRGLKTISSEWEYHVLSELNMLG